MLPLALATARGLADQHGLAYVVHEIQSAGNAVLVARVEPR
jgi:hypothetical protein